jgi:hypothetical protein
MTSDNPKNIQDHRHDNAFSADFLARLDETGEPDGAHEADLAGPWTLRPVPYEGATGFALMREWESLEAGDLPYAIFRRREMALLAAAVLPATGREPLFRLDTEPDAIGFPLLSSSSSSSRTAAAASGAASGIAPPSGIEPASGIASTARLLPEGGGGIGHLRDFDEALADALRLVAALVRSPVALAWLL